MELDEMERALREIVAPLISHDGGALYLVAASQVEVTLHLAGRYAGSPACQLVFDSLLRPLIQLHCPNANIAMTHGISVPEGARQLLPTASPEFDGTE